ncbi:MAG: tRNA lysidine(34) synthetase TilS [Oscillospiraceae bacterium]|nr:MAG: tRNA lysidine(34) synthetase TilS [Oscillospiraceae bacterium]
MSASGRTSLARAARSGRSLELEARLARYAFFSRVMQARGIPLLLTAHHADDQLETLLLRLLRGSGTHGLAGIPPVRPVPGGLLLRPLLTATRQDILDACRARGLTYVTDSTNLTDDCTRNCLRHRVVPLLEETAGSGIPQRTAARLCAAVREDDSFLCAEAERVFPTADDRGTARCRSRHSGRCTPRLPSAVWHVLLQRRFAPRRAARGMPFPPTARRSTCICRRSPP